MKHIVEVNNLSKFYQISHVRMRYHTLRDDLINLAKKPIQVLRGHRESKEKFWALKDVSFKVNEGEVLGIIGRNGAGKSTILKILSRITTPTEGSAILRGRVSSLLEVGTGFHPELTGRDNIYLNGALLGMTRREIVRKFDEIVAFAEIEKFLDTPVKYYSSGMYVRLAFAVAAHLEPEILIVDEVLAVGDVRFQKKSLQKMRDVTKGGRTVLFVSHNMAAISSLCNKVIYLDNGQVAKYGDSAEIVAAYLGEAGKSTVSGVNVRTFPLKGNSWRKGEELGIEVSWKEGMFKPGWECVIAAYGTDGSRVFAVGSQNVEGFSSGDPDINALTFFVRNPGFVENLRLDVGIRPSPRESFRVLLENCATLAPDLSSLPSYARADVVLVPDVRLK